METLDISNTDHTWANRLDTKTLRVFEFEGITCTCIGAIFQAVKAADEKMQRVICGKTAEQLVLLKKIVDTSWQKSQRLHWKKQVLLRNSRDYQDFITRVYDTIYERDADFRRALQETCRFNLINSAGLDNPQKTTLTNVELFGQIRRLQVRVLTE